MNYTQNIAELIDRRVAKINALAVGVISKVHLSKWQADVRLKSKIDGQAVELANIPIALQMFAAGSLQIAPAVDDVVIVGFSKHEVQKQLKNREVVEVNERVLHNLNHAIIMSGVYVESDAVPTVAANEILLQHKTGSFIRFYASGKIEIHSDVEVEVTFPE